MKTENKKLQKVYESDASNIIGKSCKVFIPENIEEVKKLASKLKKIVIRGGGTGLAGGCIPIFGGILLSCEKMNSRRILAPFPLPAQKFGCFGVAGMFWKLHKIILYVII